MSFIHLGCLILSFTREIQPVYRALDYAQKEKIIMFELVEYLVK